MLVANTPRLNNWNQKFLYLVASVSHGAEGQKAISHAMVLDTYDRDQDLFIFKNTYDDPQNGQAKQLKIARTDPKAPEELYFVHIEIKDMKSLFVREERASLIDSSYDEYLTYRGNLGSYCSMTTLEPSMLSVSFPEIEASELLSSSHTSDSDSDNQKPCSCCCFYS